MSTSAFTGSPDLDYTYTDTLPVTAFRMAGDGSEQRISWQAISRRSYTWPMHRGDTERANVDSFFRARDFSVESFYITDPKDSVVTGVTLGTSVTGQTTFSLPSSGEHSRYYVSSLTVKDDGTPIAGNYTIHTDARTVGLSVEPTTGSVMTADITAYRLVRLKAPFAWQELSPDWFYCRPEFVEVVE